MPDDKQLELERRIKLLNAKYSAQLPDKYLEIADYWNQYQANLHDPIHIDTFYRLVHTLKGTAATFGYTAQADICFKIQKILIPIKENQSVLSANDVNKIQTYVEELKANISTPAEHLPGKA